jgi:hypothetical protein
MYLWQLSVPIYLQLYDSGVYVAGSIHLVSGVLPYRDFAFVQPPGILLLLSPVAVVSRIFGSHDGFVLARVVSAFVTAVDASLLSWLVRHRGRVAMVVAGAGLALTPVAVFYSSGARLEPFCLCFVLLGSIAIFGRSPSDEPLTTRSLVTGGLLLGIAASIEFWAFFPFLAAAICLFPRYRQRVAAFVVGAAIGLVVPLLPFLLASPKNFVSEVFTDQLRDPRSGGGLLTRLIDMTGFASTSLAPTGKEAAAGFAVLLLLAAVSFARRTNDEGADLYVLVAAVITVCGLLAAPSAYTDYGYFAAPFLFGLLGVTVARLAPQASGVTKRAVASPTARRFIFGVVAASAVVFVAGLVLWVTTFYSLGGSLTGTGVDAVSVVAKEIPAGSCVIYGEVGLGVLANRFLTSDSKCPKVIDPFGMSMAWGYEESTPPPAYVAEWRSYLSAAQFVVERVRLTNSLGAGVASTYRGGIPWNQGFEAWFKNHYHLVVCHFVCIYEHDV